MGTEARYGAVKLSAEFALPELDACITGEHARPVPPAHRRRSSLNSRLGTPMVQRCGIALSLARIDDRYVLEFDDGRIVYVRFRRSNRHLPGGARRCGSTPTARSGATRVLEHLGHIMIHASAIHTPRGVVMFVAEAGVGKSTLAASFQSAGVGLLSDDCVQVMLDADGTVGCIPTYRSLRLWSDSADAKMTSEQYEPMPTGSTKRRFGLSRAASTVPAAVSAICVLASADQDMHEITFSTVTPARAVSLLVAQCFRLDPTDMSSTKRTFERCADIVERVPVVELTYPRDYARLPEVRGAVLKRAAGGDWTSASPE